MKYVIKTMVLCVFLGTALHSWAANPPRPAESGKRSRVPSPSLEAKTAMEKSNAVAVTKTGMDFGLSLYRQLAKNSRENLFFSPTSIRTVLTMTYNGADGLTAKQMAETLQLPSRKQEQLTPGHEKRIGKSNAPWSSDRLNKTFAELIGKLNSPGKNREGTPLYQLVVANALWGQKGYPWKENFIKTVKDSYGAGLRELNFAQTKAARKAINDWVAAQTKEKIKDIIPKNVLNSSTLLVLTNAVYFKSDWAKQFKIRDTTKGQFNITSSRTVVAPLMHQTGRFSLFENDAFQMLALPYKGNELMMFVMLPRKVDGLDEMVKSISAEKLNEWITKAKPQDVKVTLPKFKFASNFFLSDMLRALGMTDAFEPGKANFSKMTGGKTLYISKVIHKAFIAVDENGTEAAAATAVLMARGKRPKASHTFNADHPFLFLIRHNATGEVLFMGRMMNPN